VIGEYGVQAQVPADFDAPDKVLYGLTARQVAIVAAAGAALWAAYRVAGRVVPLIAFVAVAAPLAAVALVVAVGRRDGIGLDAWLLAAAKAVRGPRRLVAAPEGAGQAPAWAPASSPAGAGRDRFRRGRRAAPLGLPAERVSGPGVIDTGDGWVTLAAIGTVNFDLRTTGEQYALVEGVGRWLNSLSGPVQVVVSTRAVDLQARTEHVSARIAGLPHPALAEAADGYARFLLHLAADRDPLDRQVLIAHKVSLRNDPRVAGRLAEHTARVLAGLGAATRVLDGGHVTDVLAGACDPWTRTLSGLATPGAVITGDPATDPGSPIDTADEFLDGGLR
jgi:hypothetical protein